MFFKINADTDKRVFSRLLWLIDCFLDNVNPVLPKNSDIKVVPFSRTDNMYELDDSCLHTPSRVLSNMFWSNLNWKYFRDAFGGELSVLDIGCGSGKYSEIFSQFSEKSISKYKGIDIYEHKDWNEKYKREGFEFLIGSVDDINEIYNGEDLVLSQSVLEHVENDKKLIDSISQISEKNNKRIIQIHLVPSSPCLYKYLWHGFRQYTPRKIDALLRHVGSAEKFLVPLGGKHCNAVHFKWITLPEIVSRVTRLSLKNMESASEEYKEEREKAIILDANQKLNINKASFFAIVIDHNYRERSDYNLYR